jgi:hypothetical protein
MNIAEHRLNIVHQLEELSEESLCEIEKIIAKLKMLDEEKLASKLSAAITPAQSEQLKIGREFMQEYHETFNALAK